MSVLVVGAGLAGCVAAEKFAAEGKSVVLIDKRDHVAGNVFDLVDRHGVRVHKYGPHIFHTNSEIVIEHLSRFTEWRPYEHKVLAYVDGSLYPFPINRTTINKWYGWNLNEDQVAALLEVSREPKKPIRNSEDYVLDRVGRDLCDKFFRGYTRKQWGKDLSELSPEVAGRIPVRTNDDDRYFTDEFQQMPRDGYAAMIQRMIDHPRISLHLGTKFKPEMGKFKTVVFTGPVDEYFHFVYGRLPYRSLRFEHEHHDVEVFQPVGQVNYPNDHDFTRITEFKHLTGQKCQGTSIVKEYPMADGEPFYPVPTEESKAMYQKYRTLADQEPGVIFVGRLAEYRYYNMDQVVAATLKKVNQFLGVPACQ